MNFDMQNIFGGGFGRMTLLEDLEQGWKALAQNPADEDKFWNLLEKSYDLLLPCTEQDAVDKELIGLYTAIHDYATCETAIKAAPVWTAVAEALSGLASYSIVDIPLENARSLRAFCGDDEYVVDIDGKTIIKE